MSCSMPDDHALLFKTSTHAKWILSGEHAVGRGHPALVFPYLDNKLTFEVSGCRTPLAISVESSDDLSQTMSPWIQKVLIYGAQLLNKSPDLLGGHITIRTNIPTGCGLGSSAALCVAIAEWFVAQQWLSSADISHFAKELEHLFHGQSSGLDIAAVMTQSPIYYHRCQIEPIHLAWQPDFTLTFNFDKKKNTTPL